MCGRAFHLPVITAQTEAPGDVTCLKPPGYFGFIFVLWVEVKTCRPSLYIYIYTVYTYIYKYVYTAYIYVNNADLWTYRATTGNKDQHSFMCL